jgi:D-alanyl-D-alanine carboxypeptidase/D-alanyl-D-alanine-endopeptidase (penicillin-binding protein 4)
MLTRSGRTLIFSFFANDVPRGARATPLMDAVLNRIAAQN